MKAGCPLEVSDKIFLGLLHTEWPVPFRNKNATLFKQLTGTDYINRLLFLKPSRGAAREGKMAVVAPATSQGWE